MPDVIAWCGFLGAWLLVAGPLDQAVREVEENEFEQDAMIEAASRVAEPPQVSGWWLLLPPVWWVLRFRRERGYRDEVAAEMDDRDLLTLLTIKDVLSGWAYIAMGASLIAVKETWELHEVYEWPEWAFFALVLAMLLFCVGVARLRYHRRQARPAIDG